ncbi:MAG: divergent PAP2 family protein [Clostridia bacterium]|nr:divergent PAP2 family protein [Clostridia bacterium]
MEHFIGIVTNYVLVCSVIGWFSAQIIKCVRYIVKTHSFNFAVLMASGGMPSSHSSTVCAMVVAVARMCGTNSAEFALAFILAFIVMYDAAGVRRAAGEQAKVLNRIAKDISEGDTQYLDKNLKELIGHTPFQVIMGALLGILIPFLVPLF